jgi:dicarboxylate transporter 10
MPQNIGTAQQQQQQQVKEMSRKQKWDREHVKYPFWFGGSASCFAACVTHPLDLGELALPPASLA